eukprot:4421893-Amphidinium_carterae.1
MIWMFIVLYDFARVWGTVTGMELNLRPAASANHFRVPPGILDLGHKAEFDQMGVRCGVPQNCDGNYAEEH